MADKYNFDSFDQAAQQYDLSAFDQAHDAHSSSESVEPGQLEALLRGAAQGGTLGFADEATAKAESLLTDKPYQQALEESRQAYKASEEAHPVTSFAGNVAGGLVLPIPGGAEMAAAKGLAKAGQLAKMGAIGGALAGAGTSEADLTSREGMKDVAKGALAGGAFAPIIGQAIPAAAKNTKDWWLSQKAGRDVAAIVEKSMQNPEFATVENFKNVGAGLNEQIEKELQPAILKEAKGSVTKAYANALNPAREAGETVPIKDLISNTLQILENAPTQGTENYDKGSQEISAILKKLTQQGEDKIPKKPNMSVDDLLNIRDEGEYIFSKYGNKDSVNSDKNIAQAGAQLKDDAKAALNTMSAGALESADKVQSAYSKVLGILNMEAPTDPVARQKFLANNQETLKSMLIKQFEHYDTDEQRRLEKAFGTLVDAKLLPAEQATNLFQSLGQKAYERYLLANMHNTSELASDMSKFFMIPLNARGKAYQTAGSIGKVAGYVQRGANKVAEWPTTLFEKSPDQLQSLGNAFVKMGSPWAKAMQNVATAPDAKRKALLFTLMQQPTFRNTMDSLSEKFLPEENSSGQ